MPIELRMIDDETIVIGDVDAFIAYIENGQAQRDWHDRVAILSEECDAYLREHSYVFSHIIIRKDNK
jgi:hypothetical protein